MVAATMSSKRLQNWPQHWPESWKQFYMDASNDVSAATKLYRAAFTNWQDAHYALFEAENQIERLKKAAKQADWEKQQAESNLLTIASIRDPE